MRIACYLQPTQKKSTMPSMPSVAVIHREQILERVAAGEYLANIADSLGVSDAAISQVLSHDPEYVRAREAGMERKLAGKEAELDTAGDQLNLARARESLAHQRWRAEREFPARWGQRQQIDIQVDIGSALQRLSERLQHENTVVIEQQDATVLPNNEAESS